MKSPCTGHCAINQQQICSGCGRTRSEISNWRTMNEQEKEEAAVGRNGGGVRSAEPRGAGIFCVFAVCCML